MYVGLAARFEIRYVRWEEVVQVTASRPYSAILARDPFGDGVPTAWLPSLWIAMDREWERLPPVLTAIDLGVTRWWLARNVDSASSFTARRRVFGDRGLSDAVVVRSTVELDEERLFADVADVQHESLPLVADVMRDQQTVASTAFLLSPTPATDVRIAVVLLTATWISRHSHGEPLTSQCFAALLTLLRERAQALVLPFDVLETGACGVVVFGNDAVVEEAFKKLPSTEDDPSALVEAWKNGLTIPLLGE
jgi:hypothetical protein